MPRPGRADDFVWPRPDPKPIEIRPDKTMLETGTAADEGAGEGDAPPARKAR
jgi:hypothetical protein